MVLWSTRVLTPYQTNLPKTSFSHYEGFEAPTKGQSSMDSAVMALWSNNDQSDRFSLQYILSNIKKHPQTTCGKPNCPGLKELAVSLD